VSKALARLIANWAKTAAETALSAVADAVEMTAAAQPGANSVIAPKANAKEESPTSVTSDEACFKLREKYILNIFPLSGSADAEYSLPCFFCG